MKKRVYLFSTNNPYKVGSRNAKAWRRGHTDALNSSDVCDNSTISRIKAANKKLQHELFKLQSRMRGKT